MSRQPQVWSAFVLSLTLLCAGCGGESDGHRSDKTPGGTPTPAMDPLMDAKNFDQYAKEQGTAAKKQNKNQRMGLPTPP
jgi:hypothetical protein